MAFKFNQKRFLEEQKLPLQIIVGGIILLFISLFLDEFILNIMKQIQNPYLFYFFSWVSSFSLLLFLLAVFPILILFLENKKQAIVSLIIIFGLTLLITGIIKIAVARLRPTDVDFVLRFFDYSFPSQHAAFAIALLPIIIKQMNKWKYFYIALAIFIGISRLYLQAHYFSDIIAGALVGYIIAWCVLTFKDKYRYFTQTMAFDM